MSGRGDCSTSTRPTCAVLLATLALGAAGSGAETGNLVTSGQFDSSAQVDLWTNVNGAYSTLGYSSVDARDCAGSGAASVFSSPPSELARSEFTVCVPSLEPNQFYYLGGSFRFDSLSGDGGAALEIAFYTQPACAGTPGTPALADIVFTSSSSWQSVLATPLAPVGTQSAKVIVSFFVEGKGSSDVSGLFDQIRLTKLNWIFADGFEAADDCRWSFASP